MTEDASPSGRVSEDLVAVCGKFQPFHREHLEYVLAAFKVGQRVVIGITNPDPLLTAVEPADPIRGLPESNLWTYYQRYRMIVNCLANEGVHAELFDIVPFPINFPEVWANYIPSHALFLLTLYDDDPWLNVRKDKLESRGIRTRVLWRKAAKGITGNQIRERLNRGLHWEDLVPAGTASVVKGGA